MTKKKKHITLGPRGDVIFPDIVRVKNTNFETMSLIIIKGVYDFIFKKYGIFFLCIILFLCYLNINSLLDVRVISLVYVKTGFLYNFIYLIYITFDFVQGFLIFDRILSIYWYVYYFNIVEYVRNHVFVGGLWQFYYDLVYGFFVSHLFLDSNFNVNAWSGSDVNIKLREWSQYWDKLSDVLNLYIGTDLAARGFEIMNDIHFFVDETDSSRVDLALEIYKHRITVALKRIDYYVNRCGRGFYNIIYDKREKEWMNQYYVTEFLAGLERSVHKVARALGLHDVVDFLFYKYIDYWQGYRKTGFRQQLLDRLNVPALIVRNDFWVDLWVLSCFISQDTPYYDSIYEYGHYQKSFYVKGVRHPFYYVTYPEYRNLRRDLAYKNINFIQKKGLVHVLPWFLETLKADTMKLEYAIKTVFDLERFVNIYYDIPFRIKIGPFDFVLNFIDFFLSFEYKYRRNIGSLIDNFGCRISI